MWNSIETPKVKAHFNHVKDRSPDKKEELEMKTRHLSLNKTLFSVIISQYKNNCYNKMKMR